MSFYVYILLCCDGSFYTGYTKDLDARTKHHQNGKGARYTKSHKPQKLAYYETFDSRSQSYETGTRNKKTKPSIKNKNLVNSQKSKK